jgi:hypothetical protein
MTKFFKKQNAVATHSNRVFVCELYQARRSLIAAKMSATTSPFGFAP